MSVTEAQIDAAVIRVFSRAASTDMSDFEKALVPYAIAYHEAMDKGMYGGNAAATREANKAFKAWIAADAVLLEAARALALAYHAERAAPEPCLRCGSSEGCSCKG
jgi:hypothetical protein